MNRNRSWTWGSILLLTFLVAACTPPRELVTVTDRPVTLPSTEGEMDAELVEVESPQYPDAEVGRFDDGRMWPLEVPPTAWFEEEYGLDADEEWLIRAQRGALRFGDICSASFVSPHGLVMTNHHCARESVLMASGEGESLLKDGFYAEDAGSERRISQLKVRQVIEIEDVSEEVLRAASSVKGWGPRDQARQKRMEAIERRLTAARKDTTFEVSVVELVPAERYSAYTYRVYHDVRLVWVPDLAIGRYGGDTDNFSWPRHTLDAAFFRVWKDDAPLRTADFFPWNPNGVTEGDPVFVAGFPGSTNRLATVSQLESLRDLELPLLIHVMADRIDVLKGWLENTAAEADSFDIGNDLMTAQNTLKALEGQLRGLTDGDVIARTAAWERDVQAFLDADPDLAEQVKSPIRDIASLQSAKRVSADRAATFTHFLNPSVSSRILARAMYGYVYALSKQRGAPDDVLKDIFDEAMQIKDWPKDLEREIIARRLVDMTTHLGEDDPTVRGMFGDTTPEAWADSIATYSALSDSAGFRATLEANYLASGDVTVDVINTLGALYFTIDGERQSLTERENQLAERLAYIRHRLSGDVSPPDAAFTLRLTDGRVTGMPQSGMKGTLSSPFTTLRSLYALSDSLGHLSDWELSKEWEDAEGELDPDVALNLISTNDITGGNSGSALLDQNLSVVGLIFDGNEESLPAEFVFEPSVARAISVDARAIIETLEVIVDADRLLLEILDREWVASEAEADTRR